MAFQFRSLQASGESFPFGLPIGLMNWKQLELILTLTTQVLFLNRLNMLELWTSGFLFFCSAYDFYYEGKNRFFVYLFCQAVAFLLMGLGYCGTFVPT
jgi:hypothetical protein